MRRPNPYTKSWRYIRGGVSIPVMGKALLVLAMIGAQLLPAQVPGGGGGGYQGPGVMSRGAGGIGRRAGRVANIRFLVDVAGSYDNGFVPLQVNEAGELVTTGANYGVEISVGAFGQKSWRRTLVALDYQSQYGRYNVNRFLNGFIHNLGVGVAHQWSRSIAVDAQLAAGTTNRAIGFFGGVPLGGGVGSPDIGGPGTFIFDNRVYFAQLGGNLVWTPSSRWSVAGGGNYFRIDRTASGLVDSRGYVLQAQTGYRLNRRQQVSGGYFYNSFGFPGAFGTSQIHGFFGGWRYQSGARWNIDVQGGVFRAYTEGLTQVTLDPAVAALLGQTAAIRAFQRTVWLPTFNIGVSRNWRRTGINLAYSRGVNPGNGLFLTTSSDNGNANFNYTPGRNWTFGTFVNYTRMNSIGPDFNAIEQVSAGVNASYRIRGDLFFRSSVDFRRILTQNSTFRQNSQRVLIGISYSPGEIPISFR